MSYCPIDEAFGSFTDGLNPDPLESSSYKSLKSNNCVKKNKIKKKKINCNQRSNSFTENPDDIYAISPDVTDDDMEFNNNLQYGYSHDNIDLYAINNTPPTTNMKSKLSKKRKKTKPTQAAFNNANNFNNNATNRVNLINSMNPMNSLSNVNVYEQFQNYTNPVQNNNSNQRPENNTIRRKARISRKKPVEKNEIYEHDPEEDLPLEELKEIHGIVDDDDDSESDAEESRPIHRKTTQPVGEMNSQISEINNKINFIMNQISNKDNEIKESEHNNIHDIILFVIFGVFILIILEALYRLISKMVRANTILSNNLSHSADIRPSSPPSVGSRLFGSNPDSGSGSKHSLFSSSDPFEAVREYARSKK